MFKILQKTTWFFLIITITLLVVVSVLLIKPQLSAIFQSLRSLKTTNAETKAMDDNIAQLEQVTTDYQKISNLADKINQYIPTSPEVPDLVIQLEALAAETGNQFPKFTITQANAASASGSQQNNATESDSAKATATPTPQPTANKTNEVSGISKMNIQISLVGSFSSLLDYLNKFHTLSRLSGISSISISATQGTTGGGVSLSSDLSAYVYTQSSQNTSSTTK